jgi:hypothetical protein
MYKRRSLIIWGVFLTFVVAILTTTGIALAESKTVGDTTGYTKGVNINGEKWESRTSSSVQMYYIYVNLRTWSGSTKKGEVQHGVYYAYRTNPVRLSATFLPTAQHASQYYPGGGFTTFYTSVAGCESSFCWWYYGFDHGCSRTC